MAQQPNQPGANQNQNQNQDAQRRYTVKNSRTGESRSVTEQEYRDQRLEQAGFAKPDTSGNDSDDQTEQNQRR